MQQYVRCLRSEAWVSVVSWFFTQVVWAMLGASFIETAILVLSECDERIILVDLVLVASSLFPAVEFVWVKLSGYDTGRRLPFDNLVWVSVCSYLMGEVLWLLDLERGYSFKVLTYLIDFLCWDDTCLVHIETMQPRAVFEETAVVSHVDCDVTSIFWVTR